VTRAELLADAARQIDTFIAEQRDTLTTRLIESGLSPEEVSAVLELHAIDVDHRRADVLAALERATFAARAGCAAATADPLRVESEGIRAARAGQPADGPTMAREGSDPSEENAGRRAPDLGSSIAQGLTRKAGS